MSSSEVERWNPLDRGRLAEVRRDVIAAADAADRLAHAGGERPLLHLLGGVRVLQGDLGIADRQIEDVVVPLLPRRGLILPYVGVAKASRHSDRAVWNTEALVRDLARACPMPEACQPALWSFVETLLRCLPAQVYWRVGGVKGAGLDVDEYRRVIRGRVGVSIT